MYSTSPGPITTPVTVVSGVAHVGQANTAAEGGPHPVCASSGNRRTPPPCVKPPPPSASSPLPAWKTPWVPMVIWPIDPLPGCSTARGPPPTSVAPLTSTIE